MYGMPLVREDELLTKLLDKALELPINSWLVRDNVIIRAYYQETLKGDLAAIIRPATDVERLGLDIDVVLTVSMAETATYRDLDMLVLISSLLNTIELGYSGRDDAPAIFIKNTKYSIVPDVVKYFGTDNKVLLPIYDALSRSNPGSFGEYKDEKPDPGLYQTLTTETPPPIRPDRGGLYNRF